MNNEDEKTFDGLRKNTLAGLVAGGVLLLGVECFEVYQMIDAKRNRDQKTMQVYQEDKQRGSTTSNVYDVQVGDLPVEN